VKLYNSPEKVAAILEDAADLLERNGWTQHTLYDRTTNTYCTMGAIYQVSVDNAFGTGDRRSPTQDALNVMRKVLKGRWIPEWNDRSNRTQQEVIDKIREAAKVALTEGEPQ
jgi:hypothetical protein